MLLCKNTNIPAIGFAIQNKYRVMTTVCQQDFWGSKIFAPVRINFSFPLLPEKNRTYKIQTDHLLERLFKPQILTLFCSQTM